MLDWLAGWLHQGTKLLLAAGWLQHWLLLLVVNRP
jgi:hypothetical protein